MDKFIKVVKIIISVIMIVGGLGVAFIALPVFGHQALIVRSGSMTPTIGVGDIIVVRPQSIVISPVDIKPTYSKGDIIAFRSEKNSNTIITHRITETTIVNGTVSYKTKGDANEEEDGWEVKESQILGESFFTVPQLGKLLAFAKSKYGFPTIIIFPAVLVIALEVLNIIKEVKKNRPPTTSLTYSSSDSDVIGEAEKFQYSSRQTQTIGFFATSMNTKVLKIIIPILAAGLIIPGALAFYGDTETSTGNVLQAAAVFPTTPTPTPPTPIAQTLVINEVLPNSSCTVGQGQNVKEAQWIEIYNGFNFAVNPKDYLITDGTNTIDLVTANNLLIQPGGFLLLSHDTSIWNGCYNDNGVETGNLGGTLNINVGLLKLIDTDETTVLDVVRWNQPGDASPSANQTIERVPLGLDSATGNNWDPDDFIVREMPTPGYGSLLVLNELLSNDGVSHTTEWVEIYNPSGQSVNLTGWTLDESNQLDKSLTPLGSINPSGFTVYDNPTTGWLNDGGETLVLKDNSGKIIDQRTFGILSDDQSTGRNVDRGNTWIQPCSAVSKGSTNNGICQP